MYVSPAELLVPTLLPLSPKFVALVHEKGNGHDASSAREVCILRVLPAAQTQTSHATDVVRDVRLEIISPSGGMDKF